MKDHLGMPKKKFEQNRSRTVIEEAPERQEFTH